VRFLQRPYGISYTFFQQAVERQYLVIDVFADACWYVFPYLRAGDVLQRVQTYKGFIVAHPMDRMLITLIHYLLWKGQIPCKYHESLMTLAKVWANDAVDALVPVFGKRLAGRVVSLICSGNIQELERISWTCRLRLATKYYLRHPLRSLARGTGTLKAYLTSFNTPGAVIVLQSDSTMYPYVREIAKAILEFADQYHLFFSRARQVYEMVRRGDMWKLKLIRAFFEAFEFLKLLWHAWKTRTLGGIMILTSQYETDRQSCIDYVHLLPGFGGVFVLTHENFCKSPVLGVLESRKELADNIILPNLPEPLDNAKFVLEKLFSKMPAVKVLD